MYYWDEFLCFNVTIISFWFTYWIRLSTALLNMNSKYNAATQFPTGLFYRSNSLLCALINGRPHLAYLGQMLENGGRFTVRNFPRELVLSQKSTQMAYAFSFVAKCLWIPWNKKRTNHCCIVFLIVCLVITLVFYLAMVIWLAYVSCALHLLLYCALWLLI